jgi:murein L,D-transpeptidase YcbB/YkuD
MQKSVKIIPCFKIFIQASVIVGVIFLILNLTMDAKAAIPSSNLKMSAITPLDTTVSNLIRAELQAPNNNLYYPLSVERFYHNNGFKLAFIAPETVKTHAWDAMLFLDCVIQYGLNPADYHAESLSYDQLRLLVAQSSTGNLKEKVRFDLMLTDAMITLINNLHFGKLNPYHTIISRDSGNIQGFAAEDVLINAIKQPDLIANIERVQPVSAAYHHLQDQMRLVTGVYILDCYEMPPAEIKLMAINMERLRWTNSPAKIYLEINIPAYTLAFHTPDRVDVFKIIAGKPSTPTKVAKSTCRELITAPTKIKASRMMMPLSNGGIVYLANSSESYLFKEQERALSDGDIVVENGKKLADLLLSHDGMGLKFRKALESGPRSTTALINPVVVNVRYLTCAVEGGTLITYKDIYHLDHQLEMELYHVPSELALRLRRK